MMKVRKKSTHRKGANLDEGAHAPVPGVRGLCAGCELLHLLV